MNSVVLKGKLGAGFNDDRYTLPKDGNPGDILVKTETGSEWQKQEPATSTPDWNQNDSTASDYIKNRPFYTGEQIFTEIIPEQTYTLSSIGSGFTAYEDSSGTYPYSLEESKDYTVVYNGTTYELTSASFQNFVYVGDVGPFTTGSEPSVPFVIMAGSGFLQIVDYIGSTEVTFKISANAQEIKQIDTKYIPWKDAIGLKPPTIIRNNPENFTDDQKKMYYDLFLSGSLIIYLGEEYKRGVVLDVFYSETAGFSMATINQTGVLNIYISSSNGKWKTVDISDYGIRQIVRNELDDKTKWKLYNNSGTVPVGGLIDSFIDWNNNTGKARIIKNIRGSGLTITTETNDIVCYGDKEIVLSSSNPGSAKKFKLTVDDTGTISASEVTT